MPERPAKPSPDYLASGAGTHPSPSETLLADERDHGEIVDPELGQVGAISTDLPGRRRFGEGLSVGAWIAIGWVALVVVIAVLAKTGLVTWGDPQNSIAACARKGPFANEGSASGHLLGCDSNGRDMIARLALGGWTSLLVSVGAITVAFVIGGGLGIIAGYFGGRIDTFLTGTFNVMLSVPAIIFALALVAFLQGTGQNSGAAALPDVLILIIAIGVVSIPLVGRIARASALSWTQREFVLAARAQGAKNGRVMIRELLPNVAPALFSIALLGIAIAIVAEGTLAILGVGVKPPTPSWGNIIAVDRGEMFTSPHIVFEPSLLIFITVLALNFLGDVVRSRFDVREAGI
ncbi:MAG TPA: ABC transporter permease [Acidimicrobiia bacterium]|nr:ABC transporter permease [Acidimicrobiia bacterium]